MPCTPWTYIWLPASTPNQVSIQLCANNAGANVEATLTPVWLPNMEPGFQTLLDDVPSEGKY